MKLSREMWPVRAIVAAKGKTAAVLLAILFQEYGQVTPALLSVAFPGFRDITRPFICSGATVVATGKVVCNMIRKDGSKSAEVIYDSEADLVREFRNLADRLKLNDADRIEMTEMVKRWVVCDLRINHLGAKAVA